MDAIDTFLDAMFAPYPTTPRLLEAKGELRTMMEDAYNDAINKGKTHNEAVGQVITDFGNLEELAPTLGILPDLRSAQDGQADSGAAASQTAPAPTPSVYPVVTLPEAQQFAEARRQTGRLLGWGVALCVIAPAHRSGTERRHRRVPRLLGDPHRISSQPGPLRRGSAHPPVAP